MLMTTTLKRRSFTGFLWILYACAALQFVRYYVVSTYFYLDMRRYLSGSERLPFQERVLPIFLMWPINHSSFLMRHLVHPRQGVFTPSAATEQTAAFYIVSLLSFCIASFLVVRLYRAVTRTGMLEALVFPIFMVLTLWTYVVHIDANYSYPYDMPSLAFFAGGLLAIYTRRFLPLAAILFFGTMNRETTLFLIGIYILDSASRDLPGLAQERMALRERFSLSQVRWGRVAALLLIWLAVKLTIAHHFAHNDNSENFVRFWGNFGRLRPRLWPTLLNICGYILPVVVILRGRLRPVRFANYLYILPFWLAVMFYTGVILETRIWGELCSLTAVAAVLLLEDHVTRRFRGDSIDSPLTEVVSMESGDRVSQVIIAS
jgi:hypothetical protein